MVESNAIAKIFALVVSLLLAVLVGSLLVTDQYVALACVGGAALLGFCFWMGRDIWLLIPFSTLITLKFPWLPGAMPLSQVCTVVVVAWILLLLAMRKVRLQFKITGIEIAALILLLSILQAYIRNPVGLDILGSQVVGARAYFNVSIALATALVMGTLVVTPDKLRSAVRWMMAGGIISAVVGLVPFFMPSLTHITARFGAFGSYREVTSSTYMDVVDPGRAGRIGPASELGSLLSRWVAGSLNPLKGLLHPFWLLVITSAMVASGFGGFRNAFAAMALNLILGTFYWGRMRAVIAGSFLGIAALGALAVINAVAPLPANIQRSLSFLPGTWDKRIVEDARGSTQWRVEIWKEVLSTDRYIYDKVLGDGLGFNARELAAQQTMDALKVGIGTSGFDIQRDYILVSGDYHSGPVQTIRTTGYVGLFILLIGMSYTSIRAHRMIVRARNTPYFGMSCFLCIPMVWHPFFFVFIFGAFGTDVPLLLIHMGFLRLMEKNLLPALPVAHGSLPASAGRPIPHLAGGKLSSVGS